VACADDSVPVRHKSRPRRDRVGRHGGGDCTPNFDSFGGFLKKCALSKTTGMYYNIGK
jgi:hypothetical protein